MKALYYFFCANILISLIPASISAFIPFNMQKHIELEADFGMYLRQGGHTNFYGEQFSFKVDPGMYVGLYSGWHYSKNGMLSLNTNIPCRNFSSEKGNLLTVGGEIFHAVWEDKLFLKGIFEWEEVMGKVTGKISGTENYNEYGKFNPFLGKVMLEAQFFENVFTGFGLAVKRYHSPLVFTNISGSAETPVIYSALIPESVVYGYDLGFDVNYANYATWLFYNISVAGFVGIGFGDPNTESMNDWRNFHLFSALTEMKAECGVQLFKAYPFRGVITLGVSFDYEYIGSGSGGEVDTDPNDRVVKFKRGTDLTWGTTTLRIYAGLNFTF